MGDPWTSYLEQVGIHGRPMGDPMPCASNVTYIHGRPVSQLYMYIYQRETMGEPWVTHGRPSDVCMGDP